MEGREEGMEEEVVKRRKGQVSRHMPGILARGKQRSKEKWRLQAAESGAGNSGLLSENDSHHCRDRKGGKTSKVTHSNLQNFSKQYKRGLYSQEIRKTDPSEASFFKFRKLISHKNEQQNNILTELKVVRNMPMKTIP